MLPKEIWKIGLPETAFHAFWSSRSLSSHKMKTVHFSKFHFKLHNALVRTQVLQFLCLHLFFMILFLSILIYIISSVMHAFWLVLTYDLLEDRRIDDVIIKTFLILFFIYLFYFLNSLLDKTNRLQVAVRLFSNRSQRTVITHIFDVIYTSIQTYRWRHN